MKTEELKNQKVQNGQTEKKQNENSKFKSGAAKAGMFAAGAGAAFAANAFATSENPDQKDTDQVVNPIDQKDVNAHDDIAEPIDENILNDEDLKEVEDNTDLTDEEIAKAKDEIFQDEIDENDLGSEPVVTVDRIENFVDDNGDVINAVKGHLFDGTDVFLFDIDGDGSFDLISDVNGTIYADEHGNPIDLGGLNMDDAVNYIAENNISDSDYIEPTGNINIAMSDDDLNINLV